MSEALQRLRQLDLGLFPTTADLVSVLQNHEARLEALERTGQQGRWQAELQDGFRLGSHEAHKATEEAVQAAYSQGLADGRDAQRQQTAQYRKWYEDEQTIRKQLEKRMQRACQEEVQPS